MIDIHGLRNGQVWEQRDGKHVSLNSAGYGLYVTGDHRFYDTYDEYGLFVNGNPYDPGPDGVVFNARDLIRKISD